MNAMLWESPKYETYSDMSLERLVSYLVDIQYPYLDKAVNTFRLCSENILSTHEPVSENFKQVADELQELSFTLRKYFDTRAQVFLPFIKKMITSRKTGLPKGTGSLMDLQIAQSASTYHHKIKMLLKSIQTLTNHYKPEGEVSSSIKLCYAQLFNFEQDIQKHIFVEENILFPKLEEFIRVIKYN